MLMTELPSCRIGLFHRVLCFSNLDALIKVDSFDPLEDATPNWSCYKLIIDPGLSSGSQKLYRYDGQHFSAPVSMITRRP